jgi:hypothetical protein
MPESEYKYPPFKQQEVPGAVTDSKNKQAKGPDRINI